MPSSSKILIAYYSWGGNTKRAAEFIQQAIGGDLYAITPAQPYPTNYQACVEQAKQEIQNGVRPPLAGTLPDLSPYDTILIGSPNWWSTIAPPVATFLTSQKFSGKTVIPFFTHGGGGMARCESDTRKLCKDATFLPARTFSGSSVPNDKAEIQLWITSLLPPRSAK